jgi:hypothetical protein
MASALEVCESGVAPEWKGKQVWLSLEKLGIRSVHLGCASEENTDHVHQDPNELEYIEQLKKKWLLHIMVDRMDGKSDPFAQGQRVKVRTVPGLKGTDFIQPGALAEGTNLSISPLVNQLQVRCIPIVLPKLCRSFTSFALQAAGFTEQQLLALPWDWRLPLGELEERDQYFSKAMKSIEHIFNQNNQTKVAVVAHSFGALVATYFFRFVEGRSKPGSESGDDANGKDGVETTEEARGDVDQDGKSWGQQWLDKHIELFIPISAPFLGTPRSLRYMLLGEEGIGLQHFFAEEEKLVLGRYMGGNLLRLPMGHSGATSAIHSHAFVRQEAVLQIEGKWRLHC